MQSTLLGAALAAAALLAAAGCGGSGKTAGDADAAAEPADAAGDGRPDAEADARDAAADAPPDEAWDLVPAETVDVPAELPTDGPVEEEAAPPAVLAATPPMGWNSWNRFGCNVSDSLVRQMADALVSSGMAAAGYEYVNIDDCWQVEREDDGTIVEDAARFPHGMKALADYVHGKGLKFGVYTCAGFWTCQRRPGSQDHEAQDAATYAAWGVDYIKEDWCYTPLLDAKTQYTIMKEAIERAGREMVLSICNWGWSQPWVWGPSTGQLWRTTGDISASWSSVTSILDQNQRYAAAAGPGRWNDPDMLEVGNGGMSETEQRAHFSLWAIMAAPLIAGNDLRDMSAATRAILTNAEVIAVDQDPAGIQGVRLWQSREGQELWAKPLAAPGERAVVLFNRAGRAADVTVMWSELGLAGGSYPVRDLWTHADLGAFPNAYTATVPSHGVAMIKVTGTEALPPPGQPWVSDIPWKYAANGWGPVEKDASNGEEAAGDGRTIVVQERSFDKGLGVHAPSLLIVHLGGRCSAFTAHAGVDDEVENDATLVFQVWADGDLLFASDVMRANMPGVDIDVSLAGRRELRLVVDAAGDTQDHDHADWASARLACM